MKTQDAIKDYLIHIKAERGYSPTTVTCYQSWLRHYANWLDESLSKESSLSDITTESFRKYLYFLANKPYRPRTIRSAFHPLYGLTKFLVGNGGLDTDPLSTIKMPKKDAAQRLLVGDGELLKMLEACDRLPKPRERALAKATIMVVANCGIRCQELVDLRVDDVRFEEGTVLIRSGKGAKSRLVYPSPATLEALKSWMDARLYTDNPWLWCFDRSRRYKDNGLRTLLESVKQIAGLGGKENIKFHSIRHRFGTRMMEKGATIKQVQSALGHSDPQTTFVYLHLQERGASAMSTLGSLDAKSGAVSGRNEESITKGNSGRRIASQEFLRRRTRNGR
jgi:integrase/recombinase XerD